MFLTGIQRTGQWSTRWSGVVSLLGVLALSACAPTTTYTTYTCNGEQGCCCNSPIYYDSSAGSGNWPDCAATFECRAMQPGGVEHPSASIGRIDVNVCKSRSAPQTQPVSIASTQPAFCRADLAP